MRSETKTYRKYAIEDKPDAFDGACHRLTDRVRGFALRLTGNAADADDLVQSVMISAHVGREGYRGKSKLLSWLLGIAVRRWRDSQRGKRGDAMALDETTERAAIGAEKPLDVTVVNRVVLDRALARLDSKGREALLLVGSQGLTYKEASEQLGEPIGTVKWRVFTAMRQMRAFLAESEASE